MAAREKEVGILVISQEGGVMIGHLGKSIVLIPREDPSWGSIVRNANAAAAVASVEGVASHTALKFAEAATNELSAKMR